MRRITTRILFAAVAVCLCWNVTAATEMSVLSDLYTSTQGATWLPNCTTNWMSSTITICSWLGVTCNASGNISKIQLEYCNLSGTLPTSLGSLTALTDITLGWNSIGGTIPFNQWGSLNLPASLTVIAMSSNAFTGGLSGIELSPKLDYVEITHCRLLTGTLPLAIGTALSVARWIRFNDNALLKKFAKMRSHVEV